MKRSSDLQLFPDLGPLAVAAVSVQRLRAGLRPGFGEPDDSGQGEVIAAVVRHDLEHGIDWVRGGQTLPPDLELEPEEGGIDMADEEPVGFELVNGEPGGNWHCSCGVVTSGPRCGVCGADPGGAETQAVDLTQAVVDRLKSAARERGLVLEEAKASPGPDDDTAEIPRPTAEQLEAAAREEYEAEAPAKVQVGPVKVTRAELAGAMAARDRLLEEHAQTRLLNISTAILAGSFAAPEGDPFHGLARPAQVKFAVKMARLLMAAVNE